MEKITEEIIRAHRFGAPFIAVRTIDQVNTFKTMVRDVNGEYPIIVWDSLRGLLHANEKGKVALATIIQGLDVSELTNPTPVLIALGKLPGITENGKEKNGPIVVMFNYHKYIGDNDVIQALMNLRDDFASNQRSLVFLGPDFQIPPELNQDIHLLDEELPSKEVIKERVSYIYKAQKVIADDQLINTAVDAFTGLSRFSLIQSVYLSMRKEGNILKVDPTDLWHRKRELINSTPGLKMEPWGETFSDIGGLNSAKDFINQLQEGPNPFKLIVFVDEIDKMVSGANSDSGRGDLSGTTDDAMKVFLSTIEDHKHRGQLVVGPPGTAKSFFARCAGSTHKTVVISIDFGAAKGGIVGESERKIRAVMHVINAIAGDGGAYFIATCNRLNTITPELRRRFQFGGIWFFDLPTTEERLSIGKIQAKAFGVPNDEELWTTAAGWSGANIRDACRLARDLAQPLKNIKARVIPAAKQDYAGLKLLRETADGRFLSASYEGSYHYNKHDVEVEEKAISGKSAGDMMASLMDSGERKIN